MREPMHGLSLDWPICPDGVEWTATERSPISRGLFGGVFGEDKPPPSMEGYRFRSAERKVTPRRMRNLEQPIDLEVPQCKDRRCGPRSNGEIHQRPRLPGEAVVGRLTGHS